MKPGTDYILNTGTARMAQVVVFGYALYQGDFIAGHFGGTHVGMVETTDDAEAWVRGEDVDVLKVYPI